MQTNTDRTQDKDGIAAQPSCDSTVFMLIREDHDHSETTIFGAEFDLTIDFITAESESDVLAYHEEILEDEGFEINYSGNAMNGTIESDYLVYSMKDADFWEWIEKHFDKCVDNLAHWASQNEIEAVALLDAVDSGQTAGHLALAQHGRFRSVVEEFILESTAEVKQTGESSRGRKSL